MDITGILSKLTKLVGTQQTNTALQTLNALIPYTSKGIFTDVLRTALSSNYTDIASIVKDGQSIFSFSFEQERLARYALYTSIYKRIPFCKRAIKVIVANILSPDTVTKNTVDIVKCEDVKTDEISLETIDIVLENFRILARQIQLEKLIRRHVTEALYKGDSFIVINVHNVKRSRFTESQNNVITEVEVIEPDYDVIQEEVEESTANVLLKDLPGYQSNQQPESRRNTTFDLSAISIESVSPERVVSVTIDDICLGYLVISKRSLVQLVSKSYKPLEHEYRLNIAAKIVNKLAALQNLDDDIKQQLQNDLAVVLERLKQESKLEVRYYPPDFVQHIKVESPEYEPYGESVFSGLELDAKILLALKTALAIHRINSSTDRRVVAIEIGLPRNASNAINEFKNVMRKRKVTLDSIGTLDAIPSVIGTFETIYLPMKDGRRFIEFDRLDNLADVTTKVEEIKNIRDSIVAGTGVPPLFLGIDEIEKKATASHQNILFTRDIVDYQQMFTQQFNEFLRKLYQLVITSKDDVRYFEYVTIQFPPPKNLQIEMTAELVGSISSMISSLKDLGLPVEYLAREFLSNLLDWDKIEEYKQKQQMEKPGQEEETGGVGGF